MARKTPTDPVPGAPTTAGQMAHSSSPAEADPVRPIGGQSPIDPLTTAEAVEKLGGTESAATAGTGAPRGGYAHTDGDAMDELTARRDAILLAMLPDVAFDGWTRAAMLRGAEMAGMEREAALASFPGGPAEVVDHFSNWADREMLSRLDPQDLAAMKVRDRITLAVRTRLEVLAPYKEAVRRTIALLALPQNAGIGPRILYRTVDAMWFAAGDTSTDYNFYTKRMLLAGVQTSTLLYWLEDRSVGNADSWAFLDRRIADVMRVGKNIAQFQGLGGLLNHLPNPFRFSRHLRRTMR
ncbi:COQ9 family protein [Indioceanicola profundi]|uniref:COQ9 family protein n=1 Tax=Indioceanicola profundi TaxID=2220096 RepID=UPI001CEC6BEE|nr:COQ9 family protein [Indioceanicola profundi]